MTHSSNANFDRVSEEAHGDVLSSSLTGFQLLDSFGLDTLFDDPDIFNFSTDGTVDYGQFKEAISGNGVETNELDGYLGPGHLQDAAFECDNNRALMNALPIQSTGKKANSYITPIELSESVDVGRPQRFHKPAHTLDIVYPLERSFRPRYKSDYFAQNGKSRKPRYVADRIGNHYVTLRVPIGVRGQIRIDWLTIPDEFNNRYSMPYRFQRSNESIDVPDCNPLYLDLVPEKSGTMKLYLVLIKSKQDELKSRQSLKPFQPFKEVCGMPDKIQMKHSCSLTPKKLIQTYKLDQSQLAFTYCTLGSNGTPLPEWDTTVYSTVLTELPPPNEKSKTISCPNCSHKFPVSFNTAATPDQESVQETIVTTTSGHKRKEHQYNHGQVTKRQNSFQQDYLAFDD